ncbi:MAG TPA: PEP-CTERM sorting domain-containing protein, partial [Chthoniobacterales bacterium]|nr:PEP-CTERM sorting domain-containing protein [Chthoniobacterales bacterium]
PMSSPRVLHVCIVRAFIVAFAVFSGFAGSRAVAAISFVPGDYYSSNYFSNTITQYDPGGNVVGSRTMSNEVRGITFGPDGLFYADLDLGANGFTVVALSTSGRGSGVIEQSYSGSTYIAGNLSYGKITVTNQYLFVAGQDQLTRFLLGDPSSGTVIYTNNQVFDSVALPNGDLLVASAYLVQEITTNGTVVRTYSLVSSDGLGLNDIRGIAYDPKTNSLFVTEIGHTGAALQLLKFDGTTGALEKSAVFNGDDIQLTLSGTLLVGSGSQSPTFFDEDLNPIGTLNGGQQMFVTQLVPEPSTLALFGSAISALTVCRFGWRRAKR